ncbi:MAG: HAD family hydrolase [Lachnospirales bacterium]
MIRHLIFDIGMVLVDFRWKKLMQELGITGEALSHTAKATVEGPYWNEFDRSRIPGETICKMCCDLDPAYASQIRLYFDHIGEICREYPYAYDWLHSYKEQGYGIYLLSNYAKLSFESVQPPFSFLPLADGRVISYEVQEIKPNPAIYHILLNRYSLRPDECVFIDDNSANIDTARVLGLHGIVHTSREETDRAITRLLSGDTSYA